MQTEVNEHNIYKQFEEKLSKIEEERNGILKEFEEPKELYYDIKQLLQLELCSDNPVESKEISKNEETLNETGVPIIKSMYEFNKFYMDLEDKLEAEYSLQYHQKHTILENSTKLCELLLSNVENTVENLNGLKRDYTTISTKTNSLHQLSEQLMYDQLKLQTISEEIQKRLYYYTAINQISQTLSMPTLSVSSETFTDVLKKIDECIAYLETKESYYETYSYMVKYRHCLSQAVSLTKSYVSNVFSSVVKQVSNSGTLWTVNKTDSSSILPVVCTDAAVFLYYGKFQSAAIRVKPVIEQIESRSGENSTYEQLLNECHTSYFSQRLEIMSTAVSVPLQQLADNHRGDHSTLFRNSCIFMMQVCQDESKLFYHFFDKHSAHLSVYLETLCTALYDTLRPFTIHINHIETLAELCGKLHAEMSMEASDAARTAYQRIVWQLLQDVQERLVYRTNVYLKNDLLNYKPSAGDLAYPEKLEMMESITQSLLDRSDSTTSSSSQDMRSTSSAADLHEMWYPTVKRTVVCLSRLYRCVDRPIFQGLSQEALTICVQTVAQAAQTIAQNKSPIDGELFQIKHLLILRQQIAPFQVDFCVKEMSLDFSNVKNAAYGLIQNRNKLFSFGTNNALLEFLLEGTPQLRENLVDSRKEVDKQLKGSCESFIKIATDILIGPLNNFLEQSKTTQPLTKPAEVAAIIAQVQRNIKNRLFGIQRAMQLYLTNRETEAILFKPIENNVIGVFVQLKQILATEKYTTEDLLVIACPTPDQMKILLSSASLLSKQEYQSNLPKSDSE